MLARIAILIAVLGQSLGGSWARCVCAPISEARSVTVSGCCAPSSSAGAECCGTSGVCSCCAGDGSNGDPARVAGPTLRVERGETNAPVSGCCEPKHECASCHCEASSGPPPVPPLPSVSAPELVLLAPPVSLLLPDFEICFSPERFLPIALVPDSHQRRQAALSVWLN